MEAGMTFGRLTTIKIAKQEVVKNKLYVFWLCRCTCGKLKKASQGNLVGGRVKSCGCMLAEHREKMKGVLAAEFASNRRIREKNKDRPCPP